MLNLAMFIDILPLMEAQNQLQYPDEVWHVLSRSDSPCPSLTLGAMSCLHHPKCCWPSSLPRGTAGPSSACCLPVPKAIPQRCSLSPPAPACSPAGLWLPRIGLGLCPCWISWSPIRPFLPAVFPSHTPRLVPSENLTCTPFILSLASLAAILKRTHPKIDPVVPYLLPTSR